MIEMITGKKRCSKCKQWKSFDEFYKRKATNDGYQHQCKTCANEYAGQYSKQHPESNRESVRKYGKLHPDRIKEKMQRYQGLDWFKNKWKKWHDEHENPEQRRERRRINDENRRAKKMLNGGTITAKEWKEAVEKYGNKCLYPGCESTDVTMDHIVPISKGGRHEINNVQPLCQKHNSKKSTQVVDYRPF